MTQAQASGNAAGESAELFFHSLTNRFQRFEASGLLDHVNADALGRAVINGGEDGHRTLRSGESGRGIGSPHLIGHFSDDCPFVRIAPSRLWRPGRREQLVFPQQMQYAVLRGPDALMPKPGPDLAIALAAEHGFLQKLANGSDEFGVGKNFRAALLRFPRMPLAMPGGIEAGTCQIPQPHYARHTIGLFAGRRNSAAHGFDLQNAKGRPFSRRVIFSRSSSLSTQTPATTDFKRLTSSSSASFSRLFSRASPPAKKRSRHSLSVAAVTRCLREVDSRSAPRSNSRTTDVLRFADHRPAPGSGPDSGDCSVALRAPSAAPESALFVLDMLSLLQNIFSTNVPNELSNEIPGREKRKARERVQQQPGKPKG